MAIPLWSQMQERECIQKSPELGEGSSPFEKIRIWTADESTVLQLTFVFLVAMHKENQLTDR
jgi:hypothetical protein